MGTHPIFESDFDCLTDTFMKLIVQRVNHAAVRVNGEVVGSIGAGLCVLAGVNRYDTDDDVIWCAKKLLTTRFFEREGKQWNGNVVQLDGEILAVSQFTLYAVLKGTKPDFHNAMGGEQAQRMFDLFVNEVKKGYKADKVATGQFGADMKVELENDGPVTIEICNDEKKAKRAEKPV